MTVSYAGSARLGAALAAAFFGHKSVGSGRCLGAVTQKERGGEGEGGRLSVQEESSCYHQIRRPDVWGESLSRQKPHFPSQMQTSGLNSPLLEPAGLSTNRARLSSGPGCLGARGGKPTAPQSTLAQPLPPSQAASARSRKPEGGALAGATLLIHTLPRLRILLPHGFSWGQFCVQEDWRRGRKRWQRREAWCGAPWLHPWLPLLHLSEAALHSTLWSALPGHPVQGYHTKGTAHILEPPQQCPGRC